MRTVTVVELSVPTKLLHGVAGHGGPGGGEAERRLLPGVSTVPMLSADLRYGTAVGCDSDKRTVIQFRVEV